MKQRDISFGPSPWLVFKVYVVLERERPYAAGGIKLYLSVFFLPVIFLVAVNFTSSLKPYMPLLPEKQFFGCYCSMIACTFKQLCFYGNFSS